MITASGIDIDKKIAEATGIPLANDQGSDGGSDSTKIVLSNVILADGTKIGEKAAEVTSRGTANGQGSDKVKGGSAFAPASEQSVNEVHAPSGEEWYYREAEKLQIEHPDWTTDQITNKMSEIVWDNNYQALIDEIAHSSSPGERERLISEHQVELDKYKASGIKVDNDITYLRNVQGMPSIMMELNWGEYGQSEDYQKDQAIVKDWQRQVDSGKPLNIDFDQTYQNEVNAAAIRVNLYNIFQVYQKYGFFDDLSSKLHADHMIWGYTATLTKQDEANGYRLDYFPNVDASLRIRSDRSLHPDDLIKYSGHLRGIESVNSSLEKAQKHFETGAIAGTLGLGEPDGSVWTQFGYHLTKDAPKIDLAVSTAFGGYGLGKILLGGGQRTALSSDKVGGKIGSEGSSNAESVIVKLKYKEGWTDEQRMAADSKIEALNNSQAFKTTPERSNISASVRYKKVYGADSVPKGFDIDHKRDLQLGGKDDISNMWPLDSSVNRSFGKQIDIQIRDFPDGTPIKWFDISD